MTRGDTCVRSLGLSPFSARRLACASSLESVSSSAAALRDRRRSARSQVAISTFVKRERVEVRPGARRRISRTCVKAEKETQNGAGHFRL